MDDPEVDTRGARASWLAATRRGAPAGRPIVFGHGLGTDQTMWSHLTPPLEAEHPVIVFDHAGCGAADPRAHDARRHGSLDGYADDVVAVLEDLDLGPVCFVGHSASAMIGALAQVRRPDLFASLVMIGGSPRYLDADGYDGGFTLPQVEEFLESMERNYLSWSRTLAPAVMDPDRPELADELAGSFARTEQQMAIGFARAILLSDVREVLPRVSVPVLVLQSTADPMVPASVATYLHDRIPDAALVQLEARGHFPHVSGPDETIQAIAEFLREHP